MVIGPRTPFGYRRSDDDRFRLEVDPEAAENVKLIFSMAAKDTGTNAIIRYLNENSIPTQIQYARAKGCKEIMMMVTVHGIPVLSNTF